MSRSNPPKKKRAQDLLAEHLREQIQTGQLKENDFLLPERKLAEEHGISSRAVREALATLETEGLISRQQGRGTQVLGREKKGESGALQNIAVIFLQRMRDASTLEFFDSLQQIFQRAGYGTTILVSDNDPAKETAIVQQLVQQGVPGIVLFTAHEADSYAHLQAAQEAGVKVALFDHFFPEYPCNFVGIDDQLAGYEATAHLIHLGCSEMVLINSELNWTTHTRRERGFHDALRKHGATGSSRVVHLPMFHGTKERLREELALIERKPGEKIGFVVWNDQVALETIEALQELGWNLPDEAAIIGFADDQESSINNLSLSSMQIPREQIGQLLAYLLLDQLANPNNPPQHVAFNARLLIRESCGCYRMQKREASFLSR